MVIGVPKEIKDHEYRVSVTPEGVRALLAAGHEVVVEPSAGVGSGFPDEEYRSVGARIASKNTSVRISVPSRSTASGSLSERGVDDSTLTATAP